MAEMDERVLYLASASPRRRALVGALGLHVVAGVAPFDEDAATADYTGDAAHLAEHLARAKAGATLHLHAATLPAHATVVAADTTVLLDGQSLGKPRDDDEARQMLNLLRDRPHQVVTGVALASQPQAVRAASATTAPTDPTMRSLAVTTDVYMRAYSDDEIAAYVATGDPHDKAGAYAIQHADFRPVAAIAGCYLAVVGLPLCALAYLLATDEDATEADRQRCERQQADHARQRCPWSSACRRPFPRCEPLGGESGAAAQAR